MVFESLVKSLVFNFSRIITKSWILVSDSRNILNSLLLLLVGWNISKFDPTDMYEILVGDEYDCPADFRRMLLEDSEEFSEKLLAIEAEL